ncbi:monocarboxylate transporter 13-like [Mercenaria mercenaria]|uniref:monocarboxylate transporter 13-like n=1 Tax=Mercenaria mercenaria TaxID=6596 RepID=UPI00234E5ACD|nr:monocarboxylate transporter 13-like [Mercenaria mercenaria]
MKQRSQDVDGGWAWVVLISSFLLHMMSYGLAWSTGVYNVIFLEEFGQPKSVTAWAGSLPTAVMYGSGPIASMLSNKYGFRPVIMVGGLMVSAGLILSFFATNLFVLFFTFGVLTGAGLGVVYIPAIASVSCYFEKKLSLAAGIATSGVGIGNFLYPAIIRWLVNMYDWKQSFLILGAISLHMCVFGALMRPVKRPEIKEDQPILDITPFKKKGYAMLCVNVFLFCCGISALYIHLAAHGEKIGLNADKSAMLISGLGIANLFGRFAYGLIAYHPRVNVFILYGVSYLLSGVCICLVPIMKTFPVLMACVVIYGILSGCFGTLLVNILIELLGLHRFANGYGCLLLFMAAGQLIGASVAGAMYDVTDSYDMAFVLGGVMVILSSVVMIQPYLYIKRHPRFQEEEIIAEKVALAESTDIPSLQYMSHRDLVQMTVSLESLTAAKRSLDVIRRSTNSLNVIKPKLNVIQKKNGMLLPIHRDIEALKASFSTETI